MRATLICVVCLFFCSGFAPSGARQQPEKTATPDTAGALYRYVEGLGLLRAQGDTTAARRAFGQVLRIDSTYAPAWYQTALLQLDRDDGTAVEAARRAHELDTANRWYLQLLGQALVHAGRYGEAAEVVARLCRTESRNPDNYRLLALLYEQSGRRTEAIALLDSAEVLFGRMPLLALIRRSLLIADAQYDRALDDARRLVETAPHDPEFRVALAETYALTGNDSLASIHFDKALRLDSTDFQTLLAVSDFQNRRRDYDGYLRTAQSLFAVDVLPLDEKIRLFRRFTGDLRFYRTYFSRIDALAVTLTLHYPREERVVELYAEHLIASGRLAAALDYYKDHLDDTPPRKRYYEQVIGIEQYLQRPDSVDRYLKRALELYPDDAGLRLIEAQNLALDRDYDRAVKVYTEAMQYAASDSLRSAVWGFIGDIHQMQASDTLSTEKAFKRGGGRWRRAMKRCYEAYDRALALDPDNVNVLNNYAYFLSLEGRDLERALAMSGRVIELTDNNPTYLDTHAWVLFRMGRLDQAKRYMQQAVSLDTRRNPELMIHYGDILEALGEYFMAETYWKRALENGYDPRAVEQRLERLKLTRQP